MRRTLEPMANLHGIDIQLGNGAAERVAVHAQLFCRLTLITLMMRKYCKKVTALEFAHSFSIGNAAGMHRCHKGFQFAFHKNLSLIPGMFPAYFDSIAKTRE
jgi:hypothetical protein